MTIDRGCEKFHRALRGSCRWGRTSRPHTTLGGLVRAHPRCCGGRARSPGAARPAYGKPTWKGRSFSSTPSPSRLFGDRLALPPHSPSACDDRADDRAVAAGERPQLDVGDVVLEPPPVREAGEVAREDAQPVACSRRRRRRDAGVQADQVGLGRAGEVEVDRPADGTQVDAREQDRGEVVAARRGRVVEHGVEAVLEPGHLGSQVVVEEVRVVGRVGRVPAVLLAERDHDLVDERVREPRDLHEVAGRPRRLRVLAEHLDALPAGGRVDPDHGVRVVRPGRQRPVLRQLRDRHLERDRVRVEAADAVDARSPPAAGSRAPG